MIGNLIIDDVISVYEGEFKPGYIKRTEPRACDGFCFYLEGSADYLFEHETLSVEYNDVLFLPNGGNYNILVKTPLKYICIDFLFTKKGIPPCVNKNITGIKQEFYKFQYNWITNSAIQIPKAFELVNRIYCRIITAKNDTQLNSHAVFKKAVDCIITESPPKEQINPAMGNVKKLISEIDAVASPAVHSNSPKTSPSEREESPINFCNIIMGYFIAPSH